MKQNKAALELVVGDQANDFTFDLDEYPPLLEGIKYVDATCIEIRPAVFWGRRDGLVFMFKVFEPEQHQGEKLAGLELPMYVNLGEWWKEGKRPVPSTKIAKIAEVAGCRRRFTKTAFIGKAFRCELITTKGDAAHYTVIKIIVKRLTG